MIRQLEDNIARLIKSQQYIQSMYIIVKELVENSLDASSTFIKIYISSYEITVEDNGTGIKDLEIIGTEGVTSKSDLTQYAVGLQRDYENFSYGFRGSALFALSSVSDLEITTNEGNNAFRKDFILNRVNHAAREKGTTVKVKNIFKNCNIRRKLLQKNIKGDFLKIIKLLQCYCIVRNIVFVLHKDGKMITERGSGDILEYLLRSNRTSFEYNLIVEDDDFKLILGNKPTSKNDQQYIFVDDRPVSITSISRVINTTFSNFMKGHACFVIVLKKKCDFNVEVDKSRVIIPEVSRILNELKTNIERHFSQHMFNDEIKSNSRTKENLMLAKRMRLSSENEIRDIIPYKIADKKYIKTDENIKTTLQKHKILPTNNEENKTIKSISDDNMVKNIIYDINIYKDKASININEDKLFSNFKHDRMINNALDKKLIKQDNKYNLNTPIKTNVQQTIEIATKYDSLDYLNSEELSSKIDFYESIFDNDKQKPDLEEPEFIENNLNDGLIIEKSDLGDLKVIGQFNKGFILTLLFKLDKNYFIIIDQHAADEIYNFEKLQRNFIVKKQKLIVPCKLQCNSIDEYNILAHTKMINLNGFELNEEFQLTAVPMYKNTIFNQDDFWCLMDEIKAATGDGYIFFKRLRDIMASKACRGSIMIGDKLSNKEMVNIVNNLSTLNVPWKCPHGRRVLRVLYQY